MSGTWAVERLRRLRPCPRHEPVLSVGTGGVRCRRCGEELPPGTPGLERVGLDQHPGVIYDEDLEAYTVAAPIVSAIRGRDGAAAVDTSIDDFFPQPTFADALGEVIFARGVRIDPVPLLQSPSRPPIATTTVAQGPAPPSFFMRPVACPHRFEFRQLDMTFVCALCDAEQEWGSWWCGAGSRREDEGVLAQGVLLATALACRDKEREEWRAGRLKPPGIPGRSLEEMAAIWLRDEAWWALRGMAERRAEVAGEAVMPPRPPARVERLPDDFRSRYHILRQNEERERLLALRAPPVTVTEIPPGTTIRIPATVRVLPVDEQPVVLTGIDEPL